MILSFCNLSRDLCKMVSGFVEFLLTQIHGGDFYMGFVLGLLLLILLLLLSFLWGLYCFTFSNVMGRSEASSELGFHICWFQALEF